MVPYFYNYVYILFFFTLLLNSGDGTLRKNPVIWKNWKPSMGPALHKLTLIRALLKHGMERTGPDQYTNLRNGPDC